MPRGEGGGRDEQCSRTWPRPAEKTPADTAACYMLEALNAAASLTPRGSLYSLLCSLTPVVRLRLRLEEGDAMMGHGDGTVKSSKGIRGRPLHSLLAARCCCGPPEQTWRDTTVSSRPRAGRPDHGDTCRWLLARLQLRLRCTEPAHGRFKNHHDLVDQNR